MKEESFSDNFYWPRMTFRFSGEDYWGRFFVNGFGQLTLPSRPGRLIYGTSINAVFIASV